MHVSGIALNTKIDVMNYRRGKPTTYNIKDNIIHVYKLDDEDSNMFIHGMLYDEDGSFAFLNCNDKLSFGRDALGTKPLYYSIDKVLMLASDARALNNPQIVEPGVVYEYDGILRANDLNPLRRIDKIDVDIDEAKNTILYLLKEAIRRRASKSLIGISGIDSIIIAKICNAKQAMVCINGSYDHKYAEKLSNKLDLDIDLLLVDEEQINNVLPIVKSILPFKDAMNISIGTIFYMLAKYAKEQGYDSIILGQLADELFAGYARYTKQKDIDNILYNDVINAWKVNFVRDEMVTSPFVELILPYASLPLVKYVLSLKSDLKIRNGIRKFILKEVARMLDIDDEFVTREKKAVQFSSGIFKIIKRLI